MKKMNSKALAGTAILAVLVIVLDYTMKYSGLKIPFPWLPILKFDFTGIPIVLSLLLFDFNSGIFTSMVAFTAILSRSGDFIGSSMKAFAELSTISGISIALKVVPKFPKSASLILGVSTRCLIMFVLNLVVLPEYYNMSFPVAIGISPLIVVFNAIQGSINILCGYSIYNATKRRILSQPNQSQRRLHRNKDSS